MPKLDSISNEIKLFPKEVLPMPEPPDVHDAEAADDQIYRIPKSALRDPSGRTYAEFKRALTPKYLLVWRDIALGYIALAVLAAALIAAQSLSWWAILLSIPAGALLFGYVFAYINLFFHEAAHWNLARARGTSDRLADWFIGIFFGQSIAAYRTVHFGHHQHHGTPADSEHSYFDVLNMRFIVGSLFGVRALQVARQREKFSGDVGKVSKTATRLALARGLALNGLVVGASLWTGHWAFALAWGAGLASVFPFFNAARQVLEHRDELADDSANYAEVAHGRINRLFGDGLLAQTLGGAGFNRHLLHHWEPQISYTRLADLESFVLQTEYAHLFRQRQTTYARVFFRLLKLRSA